MLNVTRLFVCVTPTVGLCFVCYVPWYTKSEMPLAHFFQRMHVCVCDCVKVLPHCLLSVSIASLGHQCFPSQLHSALTACLHRGVKTLNNNSGCNCICTCHCIWSACVHVEKQYTTLWFSLASCVRMHGFAFLFAQWCAHFGAGLFIRSVGRCAFCWLCLVQSPRLVLINSIPDLPRLRAADWLSAWQAATA